MTADVTVTAGTFAAVRVTGVSTRPESATEPTLAAIAAGLIGAPADLPLGAVAARVRAAVPFGVELVGATVPELASAIRTAANTPENSTRIGAFTTADIARLTAEWPALGWQILPETPLDALTNVALDEVLVGELADGHRPPTLRFWGWAEPAVVLGRSQSVSGEVDGDEAAARGVRVVRRLSGGGAMFVEPGRTITYSLVLPESAVAGLSIRQSYEVCDAWAVLALRGVGADAHYVPVNDIGCGLGKIAGSAQARRRGVVLHHATMAYDLDSAEMARVLRLGRPRASDRGVASAPKVVAPLRLQTDCGREAVVAALAAEFTRRFGGTPVGLTTAELATACDLVRDKYATADWLRPNG